MDQDRNHISLTCTVITFELDATYTRRAESTCRRPWLYGNDADGKAATSTTTAPLHCFIGPSSPLEGCSSAHQQFNQSQEFLHIKVMNDVDWMAGLCYRDVAYVSATATRSFIAFLASRIHRLYPPPLPRFDSRGIFLSIRLFWSLLHWATPMLSPCRLPSSFHFGSASVSVAPTAKAMARHHHHHNSVWLIMLGYWYTPGTDEWAAGISGEISGGFVRQETLIACLMAEGIKRSTPPICLLPVTAASYQLDAITTFPRKT